MPDINKYFDIHTPSPNKEKLQKKIYNKYSRQIARDESIDGCLEAAVKEAFEAGLKFESDAIISGM